MKSAIEKLFYGEINHSDIPVTEEWKRLADKSLKVYKEFYTSLTEKQKKQFDNIYDYEIGQQAEALLQHYKAGFKLGLTLAAEVFLP